MTKVPTRANKNSEIIDYSSPSSSDDDHYVITTRSRSEKRAAKMKRPSGE